MVDRTAVDNIKPVAHALEPISKKLLPYDRNKVSPGILHIGAGRFHRAHQALYCHELLRQGDYRWGISAAFILEMDRWIVEAMRQQSGVYTLLERDKAGDNPKLIGSIVEVIDGYSDPQDLIHRIADKNIKIISCTVTEAGYYFETASNRLNLDHSIIQSDAFTTDSPKSLYGYLALGLALRRMRKGGPVTIQSCDNIQGNGDALRAAFMDFLGAWDINTHNDLQEWVENSVTFPNSMVDRITPAAEPEEPKRAQEHFQCEDRLAVTCERYRQWVIEDRYCNECPEWSNVGVQVVDSVKPYEKIKIRLLNAGQSMIAYSGYLAGFKTIADIVNNHQFYDYLLRFFQEVERTLPVIPNFDISDYQFKLIERLKNPAIIDQTLRICKDGATKIPGFILPSLIELLAKGQSTQTFSFMLASYYEFISQQVSEYGIDGIDDVCVEILARHFAEERSDIISFFKDSTLFGSLSQETDFIDQCLSCLNDIRSQGIIAALPKKV